MSVREAGDADDTKGRCDVKRTTRNIRSGKFTELEDMMLLELVKLNGARIWSRIAEKLGTKTGRQCRDRYNNYLNPCFSQNEWSNDEDSRLESLYEVHGPRWSMISRQFEDRSVSSVRNRWCLLERHKSSTKTKDCPVVCDRPKKSKDIQYDADEVISCMQDVFDEVFEDMIFGKMTS